MTRGNRYAAALAAAGVLLAAAGCGSSEQPPPAPGLPRATAARLAQELDLVQDRVTATRRDGTPGSCADIDAKSFPDISLLVERLPDDVDPDVRGALDQGLARLKELTEAECEQLTREIRDRREATTPEPADPPAVTTTEPEPSPEHTDTQEQPVPEPEEAPEKPKKPKDKDDGGGGVGPNGQGPPGRGGGGQPAPAPEDP